MVLGCCGLLRHVPCTPPLSQKETRLAGGHWVTCHPFHFHWLHGNVPKKPAGEGFPPWDPLSWSRLSCCFLHSVPQALQWLWSQMPQAASRLSPHLSAVVPGRNYSAYPGCSREAWFPDLSIFLVLWTCSADWELQVTHPKPHFPGCTWFFQTVKRHVTQLWIHVKRT